MIESNGVNDNKRKKRLITCNLCGNQLSERASACPKCGTILKKTCHVCHNEISLNSIICPECGDPSPFRINTRRTDNKKTVDSFADGNTQTLSDDASFKHRDESSHSDQSDSSVPVNWEITEPKQEKQGPQGVRWLATIACPGDDVDWPISWSRWYLREIHDGRTSAPGAYFCERVEDIQVPQLGGISYRSRHQLLWGIWIGARQGLVRSQASQSDSVDHWSRGIIGI